MQVIATVMLMLVSLVASAGDNLKACPAAGGGIPCPCRFLGRDFRQLNFNGEVFSG